MDEQRSIKDFEQEVDEARIAIADLILLFHSPDTPTRVKAFALNECGKLFARLVEPAIAAGDELAATGSELAAAEHFEAARDLLDGHDNFERRYAIALGLPSAVDRTAPSTG